LSHTELLSDSYEQLLLAIFSAPASVDAMNTVIIRSQIFLALQHEAETHELAGLLARRLQAIRAAIALKGSSDPLVQLMAFIGRFVNRTPLLLDTLIERNRGSWREDLSEALLGTCVDYFYYPPEVLTGRSGLNGVLAKTYLCHRLVEELNDYCAVRSAEPVLPVDFTCSNLVVHQLIGEPLGNLLDELIYQTATRLQELRPEWFAIRQNSSNAPQSEGDNAKDCDIRKICEMRSLKDEQIATLFSVNGYLATCTIH